VRLTGEDLEILGRLVGGGVERVLGRLERVLEEQRVIVRRLDLILERLTRNEIERLRRAAPAHALDRPAPVEPAPARRRRGA
jgi:hypothetical protein